MTTATTDLRPTDAGYTVTLHRVDLAEARAALQQLAARAVLIEVHAEAEHRMASDRPFGGGIDREEFRRLYGR